MSYRSVPRGDLFGAVSGALGAVPVVGGILSGLGGLFGGLFGGPSPQELAASKQFIDTNVIGTGLGAKGIFADALRNPSIGYDPRTKLFYRKTPVTRTSSSGSTKKNNQAVLLALLQLLSRS